MESRTKTIRSAAGFREMGLGKAGRGGVDLKQARAKRDDLRALLDSGLDPLDERRRRRAEQDAKKSFAEVAALTVEKKRRGWKGTSSLDSWTRTLRRRLDRSMAQYDWPCARHSGRRDHFHLGTAAAELR
jgi:hypothetical protein